MTAGSSTPERRGLVLYIEDSKANRVLVEQIVLRYSRLRFVGASNGAVGLQLVEREPPDLILLDLNLPGMSGAEILHRLKSTPAARAIPVIILSADVMDGHVNDMLAAGASAYLTKPINLDLLVRLLQEIGARVPGGA